jgi:hypothetical protein
MAQNVNGGVFEFLRLRRQGSDDLDQTVGVGLSGRTRAERVPGAAKAVTKKPRRGQGSAMSIGLDWPNSTTIGRNVQTKEKLRKAQTGTGVNFDVFWINITFGRGAVESERRTCTEVSIARSRIASPLVNARWTYFLLSRGPPDD